MQVLLGSIKTAIDSHLSMNESKKRMEELRKRIIDPKKKECTRENVSLRFSSVCVQAYHGSEEKGVHERERQLALLVGVRECI